MNKYESKQALKNAINMTFNKYIQEFESIPENLKDFHCNDVDRSPAENLAYQVGWTSLLLQWEDNEKKGVAVKTPSLDFKWNQLGDLYQWFNITYGNQTIKTLSQQLTKNIEQIFTMIDDMSHSELFDLHQRKWADEATKTATWSVAKFIHINTFSPFGSFRTKIRKWKKTVL